MENCVFINLKKEEIVLKIADDATQVEIMECLKNKLKQLKQMYQEEKIPIFVTGKVLKQKEIDEINELIKNNIDVKIKFDSPTEMGLSVIRKIYEKNTDVSETLYHKGSLRGGQKLEYEGSIVIIGDVNGGAEVLAGENIVVLGTLRGLAHAGAKGNKKAIIASNAIDTLQLRIANCVKEIEKDEIFNKKIKYAYISDKDIILE